MKEMKREVNQLTDVYPVTRQTDEQMTRKQNNKLQKVED